MTFAAQFDAENGLRELSGDCIMKMGQGGPNSKAYRLLTRNWIYLSKDIRPQTPISRRIIPEVLNIIVR